MMKTVTKQNLKNVCKLKWKRKNKSRRKSHRRKRPTKVDEELERWNANRPELSSTGTAAGLLPSSNGSV